MCVLRQQVFARACHVRIHLPFGVSCLPPSRNVEAASSGSLQYVISSYCEPPSDVSNQDNASQYTSGPTGGYKEESPLPAPNADDMDVDGEDDEGEGGGAKLEKKTDLDLENEIRSE